MTTYLFLMYDDESWYDQVTDESWQEAMRAHRAFVEAVEAAGARVLGGNALQRSSMSTTVRNKDGAGVVTDGPFVETKEAMGGYYLIDAPDVDVALALAAKCPSGVVEVRPIMATGSDSTPDR